ncbi:helix-turn-helix domain-containing protein [Alloyangia pacifica]|uniref:Helix-turn-helix domain-containing protein n=1 Tax=Alloyangia pacifica TaxID=311180 RepID=A0A1I6PQL0_9RHOB|nr:helix-turn-helix domain-containing protein [Alloyangia pacifica]SDG33333.1 Helix-turn-helix domain-containing protein [Alloyangia pacifica]SFS42476.1 Helix-turn-helix domain-containing protein [Alloyangia pacifica]
MQELKEGTIRLPAHVEAQLEKLIQAIPRPRHSATVAKMLTDAGLLTEQEVAELLGWDIGTAQTKRARGDLPPFYKVGSAIFYKSDDIVEMITAERIENAAHRRRRATARALL